MTDPGRDRVRELLDAVLADDNVSLSGMAAGAHSSEFHFSRQVSRFAGESPVAMRRRVMLERACWYLRQGSSVTEVAFDSGYDTVEGFSRAYSRAFGHPPSSAGADSSRGHWLPAPNGIHFHSPTGLYVEDCDGAGTSAGYGETAGNPVALMVRHDLDDVTALLDAATGLEAAEYERIRLPEHRISDWQGPDDSIAHVLAHLVADKVPWLAAIEGHDAPADVPTGLDALIALHQEVSGRWLALIREIDRHHAWADRVIDAICEPPESFLLSEIVAHVLTFAAHRRVLVRMMMRDAGVDLSPDHRDPDPIMWHRNRTGGLS